MIKKNEEEDQEQIAILNFQAMTETSDQELALKYLTQHNFDVTVLLFQA